MMINRRLIGISVSSKKYIAANVFFQWCSLISNITMIFSISHLLQALFEKRAENKTLLLILAVVIFALLVRFLCTLASTHMSFLSAKAIKWSLREQIYKKLLELGPSYHTRVKTSEVVQITVEGVEQLENYFGSYLPQFFYSLLAPLTLFAVLSFVNLPAAAVLLICVPLIPISIAAVQTFAKKLLSKYWSQYTTLGDSFLENLQGLTTLKIYQADERKHREMNQESEKFRKITMKVLSMQLNSVTIMDLIAYGGAALGIIISVIQLGIGQISLAGCLAIILLSADFFIPMRILGSFFHIAMNGMAASEKIFRLLDLPCVREQKKESFPESSEITCHNLHFAYEQEREILHGISLKFPPCSLTAIVGESGCGKSTIASILTGKEKGFHGSVLIGGTPLSNIKENELVRNITAISYNSYLFAGTVRENLCMGMAHASDQQLWDVLKKVNLDEFFKSGQGLNTRLTEKAENLSGGQRQRLALARALLHDSPIYIFDEATSNIDAESENDIMAQIYALSEKKTVIMITHRLMNALNADQIYVLKDGTVTEYGTHDQLLKKNGDFASMWNTQSELESYTTGVPA